MAGLGSVASPWPRPAGGTAPARRSTGSWWSAGAAWASRRSRSSSSRCLERACRGRRGGGGRGLTLPVVGRPSRPRPGGAARARGGRAGGVGSRFCPPTLGPQRRTSLPCALLGVPGVGLLRNVAGRAELEGGKRRSTLSLRRGPEPSRIGSSAAPGFLPGGPGRRASGWSRALWVSSRHGRLLHSRCGRSGNLAAAPRGLRASPLTLN